MDSYDIFKKLSRGVKFSRESRAKTRTESAISIKTEIEDDKISVNVPKHVKEENGAITLLRTLNNASKGHKRKHSPDTKDDQKKKLLREEEINHYRNVNNISVVGKNVPEPYRSFDDFPVDQDIVTNIKDRGYTEPTPIQKQATPVMIQGRNLLACAPTGSGKTAAFLIPIIHDLKKPKKEGFRALILCPTRELAKQTQRECMMLSEGRGLRIHIISNINRAISQYGPGSSHKYDILITTPNRLCFLLKQEPAVLSLEKVKWVVVDEADKLFEEGNRGFREQLEQILGFCTSKERRIAMFSATCTPVVAKWCVRNMKKLLRVTIGHRNSATDSVDQELIFVGNEQGKLLAFRDLIKQGLHPPVLIFLQSKDRAQQLFNELIYDGINVDVIHADRTQVQRDNTVKSFREGKIWVLICTELMARGIDFKGVNLVVNYDFPTSVISYVHRIGRAGRAGRRGRAVTFFTIDDSVNLRSIAHVIKESGGEVPDYMLTMKKKSKKEKKKLQKSSVAREEINTTPKYQKLKELKRNWKKRDEEGIRRLKKEIREQEKAGKKTTKTKMLKS